MLDFTNDAEVLALLRLDANDANADRVSESVTVANFLVFTHIGRADNDAKFSDENVLAVCSTAARIVAREVYARPGSAFGLLDSNEMGAVFMSKDTLAGVRVMLGPIRDQAIGFGV